MTRSPQLARAAMRSEPLRLTALAFGLWVAYGTAHSQTAALTPDEVRRDLYSIESKASLGVAYVSADKRRFGQYNGLNQEGYVPLVDLDLIQRDEATGTWVKLRAVNFGLDSREVRFTQERQGDWAYGLKFSQFTRREPFIVNTGLQGMGTANQTVSASAPKRDVQLQVDRDVSAFNARKVLPGGWDLQFNIQQDESKGARMLGRGTTNVMEFLTEPIDRITRQWLVSAGYADRQVQVTGGYNGSTYENRIPVLNSTGGNTTAGAFGAAWVMAMPPSNSAHQWHLSGGVNWADNARSTFKFSRTIALQNEVFDPSFIRLATAPESFNGRVVTTLAFADTTLRPAKGMDVVAQVRVEDRDDQTPVAQYLAEQLPTVGGNFSIAGVTGFNKPRSLKQFKALLETGYQLDEGVRLSMGVEEEDMKRNVSPKYRRVGMRETTSESTLRFDVKRNMSSVLNGGVALLFSQRDGSDYVPDTYDVNALTNQVNALMWADRGRTKLRATADWLPDEQWSLQFLGESSQDTYTGRNMGPRDGHAEFFSADLVYKLSDKWNLSSWLSQEFNRTRQITRSDRVGAAAAGYDTVWDANVRYLSRAAGLTLKGKLRSTLDAGVDYSNAYHRVENITRQIGGTGTMALPVLPRMYYRQQALKFFVDQELSRKSGVRAELQLDRRQNNDWTWDNWVYNGSPAVAAAVRTSDGTTVRNAPLENVAFVAISYHYRWR